MVETLRKEEIKAARKDYYCDASVYVRNCEKDCIFTFAEKRAIVKARQQKWRILKGQPYVKEVNIFDGDIYTFRYIPEMGALCRKYELYPEV